MDAVHRLTRNESPHVAATGAQAPSKRPLLVDDEIPAKKIRPTVEVPMVYSDAVRRKLAATSRTGQACDRCKERKMKCDTNPVACQPCRQKNLRCYTTDRVTGQSRERGQTDRAENELQLLREQNAAYQKRYGPLDLAEFQQAKGHSPAHEPSSDDRSHCPPPPPDRDKIEHEAPSPGRVPDTQYIGWPAPTHIEPLHPGPVNGTNVDILDGIIDIADFPCDMMDDPPVPAFNVFNLSRTSIMNTLTGYQQITDPRFPSKEQAVQDANTFLVILSQYVPVVHRPSFIQMVHRIYDQPPAVSQAERVQLAVVLSIVEQQTATRNHREAAEKFEQSHHHIHYALTHYRELFRDRSLASMQALALILVHFRNLPKPGFTWGFGHNILVKAMDMEYHRDPDRIQLPRQEDNVLAKELRKRVFHSILGICVTTGCRVGRPAPWQFSHIDVPLPLAVKDTEISETGLVSPLSGLCEFWPCLQLAKLLPLLTEMYNYVTSVRRTESEYVKTVEILHGKIDAWRRDWDESIRHEDKHVNLQVATLLIEGWAAEYILNLYHPSLYPTRQSETMDKHLDICHKQSQRLLKSFHTLSGKYKGVDFTWHSTVAYAMSFGVTLYVYQQRIARVSTTQFDSMKNELKGWMSLMAYADLVLRTGNHLQHIFEPRVRRLEAEYEDLMRTSPTDSSQQQQYQQQHQQQHQQQQYHQNHHYHHHHHHQQQQRSQHQNQYPHHQQQHLQRPNSHSTPTALPNRPFIKPEPSPQPNLLSQSSSTTDARPSHVPSDLVPRPYSTTQPVTHPQPWSHSSHSFAVPSPGTAPTYATYTASASPYSSVPSSLAPILNEQSNGYMSYSPATPNTQNDMMMFHPNHYTDSPATMMWPLITLPHQDQIHQHQSNGQIKFQ